MSKLNSLDSFNARVCELSRGRTRKKAWELTEKEYQRIHGESRYSTYNSFKAALSRNYKES